MKNKWWFQAALFLLLYMLAFLKGHLWSGFYVDDWGQALYGLKRLGAGTLWELIASYWSRRWAIRPLAGVWYCFCYWALGGVAWKYQTFYFFVDALGALALFYAIYMASRSGKVAFVFAVLAELMPNHNGARFWNNQFHPAHICFAVSMATYAVWLNRRSARWLVLAVVWFLIGGLNYEAYTPLPIFGSMLGLLWRDNFTEDVRSAAWASLIESWPFYAVSVLLVIYSLIVQKLFPETWQRGIAFDPAFFLKVFGRGIECNTSGLAALTWKTAPVFLKENWPFAMILLSVTISLCAIKAQNNDPAISAHAPDILILFGAAVLFCGYIAPAISSGRYLPHIFDIQNRVNAAPSLGAAAIYTGLILRIKRASVQNGIFWGVTFWFIFTNAAIGFCWEKAWKQQQRILLRAGEVFREYGATRLALSGDDYYLGAPVFAAGFGEALKFTYGDQFSEPFERDPAPPQGVIDRWTLGYIPIQGSLNSVNKRLIRSP